MKKFIATLLSLALVIGMCPAMASAETTLSGEGTEEKPYIISNAEELKAARDMINADTAKTGASVAYYEVTADIDLNNEAWTPIGVFGAVSFSGHFDGGNHKISNVKIEIDNDYYDANYTAQPALGFFGRITAAGTTVSNLGIENISVINNSQFGTTTVQRKISGIGGFVGSINNSSAITNCYVKNAVLQHNNTTITSNVGGFAGSTGGNQKPAFKNCYVYNASVSGNGTLSGFIGDTAYSTCSFENCYAGKISTTEEAVAKKAFYGFGKNSREKTHTLSAAYSEADDIVTEGSYDSAMTFGTVGMTKEGLVEAMTAVGYSAVATINNGYPCLSWELPVDTLTGTGTETDPYVIESASDLKSARDLINADTDGTGASKALYELVADIDLENETWVPIAPFGGDSSHNAHAPFTGTFNGNGHVIKNINIPLSNTYNSENLLTVGGVSTVGSTTDGTYKSGPSIGLFGAMNGIVTDLGVDGIIVTNTSTWCADSTTNWNYKFYAIGSIAGLADGTFERCYVKNSSITYNGESQSTSAGIGGFIGNLTGGTYTDCYIDGVAVDIKQQNTNVSGFASTSTVSIKLTNCFVNNATATFNEGNTGIFFGFMQGGSVNYPSINLSKKENIFTTAADSETSTITLGEQKTIAEIAETLLAVENTNWKAGTGIKASGAPALAWETAPVVAEVAPYVVKAFSAAKGTVTLTVNEPASGDVVYVAAYDADGRLVSCDVKDVAADITDVEVSTTGASTLKVFIWNNVNPVISAVSKTICK